MQTFDIQATENEDYEFTTSNVLIREGELTGNASIRINDDDLLEINEEFLVSIIDATNNIVVNRGSSSVLITIEDDDTGEYQLKRQNVFCQQINE